MAKTRADLDSAISGQTDALNALATAVGELVTANQALVKEIQDQGATEDFSAEVDAVNAATTKAQQALTSVQAQTAADAGVNSPPATTTGTPPAGATTTTDPGTAPAQAGGPNP